MQIFSPILLQKKNEKNKKKHLTNGNGRGNIYKHSGERPGEQKKKLVLMTVRVHPFPFRTRKLSSLVPKILDW